MKQIILPFRTGKPLLTDVPAPSVQPGTVLIRTTVSVISAGTERMLIDFGKANWWGKIQQQPEKVKQVLDKIRTDGLSPTIRAVRSKLDKPIPLGYSQAGVVVAVGDGIQDLKIGDRVASNGTHAELVCVPRNLVARIPESVFDES
ncbi:MAG: alcohol dehydrogenase catalytic domain-containing protein, partial [Chitinophagaceae bacterium]